MKSKYIVFVPGALQQFTGFKTHEAKCGPISSFHDRACEVFALIKEPRSITAWSTALWPVMPSRDYTSQGLVPDWAADNPIILIDHNRSADMSPTPDATKSPRCSLASSKERVAI
jgi:hypothetical protein